jgi:hypothetical protein
VTVVLPNGKLSDLEQALIDGSRAVMAMGGPISHYWIPADDCDALIAAFPRKDRRAAMIRFGLPGPLPPRRRIWRDKRTGEERPR